MSRRRPHSTRWIPRCKWARYNDCPRTLQLTHLLLLCSNGKDLPELSQLGHFLKGSSAAVGVIKVRDSCECMQHYGKKVDEDGITELSEDAALSKLTTTLTDVKGQYKEAEETLRRFYDDLGDDGE